jgi:protein-L-isoaspartate O-methyltransferase
VDRKYFVPLNRVDMAHSDNPLKEGNIHISAPHIYGTVLEALDIQPSMSFLNIGNGTGYLTALVSVILGRTGQCTGIELYDDVVTHAAQADVAWRRSLLLPPPSSSVVMDDGTSNPRPATTPASTTTTTTARSNVSASWTNGRLLRRVIRRGGSAAVSPQISMSFPTTNATSVASSPSLSENTVDNTDLPPPPTLYAGNIFSLDTQQGECCIGFDRIYIGAAVSQRELPVLAELLKPGGILVGPGTWHAVSFFRICCRKKAN